MTAVTDLYGDINMTAVTDLCGDTDMTTATAPVRRHGHDGCY